MIGNNSFNRYTNLDGLEWRVIWSLLESNSKHAQNLWKMLAYADEDCLFKPNLTKSEKIKMIYRDSGDSSSKRVFMMPYVDDAWESQASRIDVFIDRIIPINHITSQVNICVEILVHNKINNILGDAEEGNPLTNPSELDEDGNPIILSKSRSTALLKSVLAELNGKDVAGVGQLQHNTQINPYSMTRQYVWNNRAYFGYAAVFTTLLSGVSDSSEVGY